MVPAKAEDGCNIGEERCLLFPHTVVASLGQIRNAKYVAAPHYPCLCGPAPNQHLPCSVLGLVTSWRDLGLLGGYL